MTISSFLIHHTSSAILDFKIWKFLLHIMIQWIQKSLEHHYIRDRTIYLDWQREREREREYI